MFVLRALSYYFILQVFTSVTSTNVTSNSSIPHMDDSKMNNVTTVEIIKINPIETKKSKSTTSDEVESTTPTIIKPSSDIPKLVATEVSTKTTTTKATTFVLHFGREGEMIENDVKTQIMSTSSTTSINVLHLETNTTPVPLTQKIIPVSEKATSLNDIPLSTEHGKIVPKKGVNFIDIINTTETLLKNYTETQNMTVLTTHKPKPKKPTVTITDEEPSNVLSKQKNNGSGLVMPSIELFEKNKEQNQKYNFVIPIVAVILSVPVVAIVMNILYKRGKEWWSHRHYSRMDFLIDGMYNN